MLEKIETRIKKEVERILDKEELNRDEFSILVSEYNRLKFENAVFACPPNVCMEV